MTHELSIFLIADVDGDATPLYWFGRPSPSINTRIVSGEVLNNTGAPDPVMRQRITEFLADTTALVSAPLGTDTSGRTLKLHRAPHHRDRRVDPHLMLRYYNT